MNPGHLLAFLLALVASSAPYAATDFDSMLAEARSARLEPSRAVRVSDLELDLGRGTIRFEDGVFIPATEVAGGTREVVFVGRARFSLEPPDAVEREQLFVYTGMRRLSVTVDRAVFVAGNESEIQRALSQPAAHEVSPRQRKRATELFGQWRDSEGRRPWSIDEIIVCRSGTTVTDMSLSERVNNRLIDTETFIKAVEHMSGRDLTEFANRYVYGTGLPSVYYDYRISPRHDGGWMVEGMP